MRVDVAGQAPASSATAPAGSREAGRRQELRPAEVRRRTTALMARSADLGQPMRRKDAFVFVTEQGDVPIDGWNQWLAHRFNPTRDAVMEIVGAERGGRRG